MSFGWATDSTQSRCQSCGTAFPTPYSCEAPNPTSLCVRCSNTYHHKPYVPSDYASMQMSQGYTPQNHYQSHQHSFHQVPYFAPDPNNHCPVYSLQRPQHLPPPAAGQSQGPSVHRLPPQSLDFPPPPNSHDGSRSPTIAPYLPARSLQQYQARGISSADSLRYGNTSAWSEHAAMKTSPPVSSVDRRHRLFSLAEKGSAFCKSATTKKWIKKGGKWTLVLVGAVAGADLSYVVDLDFGTALDVDSASNTSVDTTGTLADNVSNSSISADSAANGIPTQQPAPPSGQISATNANLAVMNSTAYIQPLMDASNLHIG